jgi:formylglycine-generating enzyme required for sulfatase activity
MKRIPLLIFVSTLAAFLHAQVPRGTDFILVKGGTFTMGSPASEAERGADEVQRRVTVGDFYIAKYEVTQKEYRDLTENNPSEFDGDDMPVENVTWFDAVRYCNARSVRERLTPAYALRGGENGVPHTVTWNRAANGYRLPTEAEWEYACRAGTTGPFNVGNNITDAQANCYNHYGYNNTSDRITGGYRGRTTPVRSFRANDWGLFDMHGNVSEWCWDWYGDYGTGAQTDPAGATTGTFRVNRGGGWNDFPKHIRSAYRALTSPNEGMYSIGFRLARNP